MVNIHIDNQIIENIELFVFDKDGTLIDLYNYWFHMIELRAKKMCECYDIEKEEHQENLMFKMGVDSQNKRLRPEGPVGLLPRWVVQKAAENYLEKLDCSNVENACFQIFKEVDKESLALLDVFIKPIDGAIDLLKDIKRHNLKIAIATTDRTNRTQLALDFLKISSEIDFIVGADMVEWSKPNPQMLQLITEKLRISPENSVMVGDAKTDVEMGVNANFKASIGIYSGMTAKSVLAKITPYLIEGVSEIKLK